MRRVVIDTNVFISSFFGGYPRKVINCWISGEVAMCLCPEIIDEYYDVLQRLGLADKKEMEEVLQLFKSGHHMLFTTKIPVVSIVAKDPDDDKFIACAIAHKAKHVITGDKALLKIRKYMDIEIITPKDFIECMMT